LPELFAVSQPTVKFEPLGESHIADYFALNVNGLVQDGIIRKALWQSTRWVEPIVKETRLHRLARGHSIYACFRKL
jgi:hypothetical protein